MPNTQGPWGFRPLRRIDGVAPNYQITTYQIAYNNTNQIARGDPVLLNTNGQIDILAPGTTAIFGVFWGCEFYNPNDSGPPWHAAWLAPSGLASTTVVLAQILDDVKQVFEVQAGQSSTTPIVQADIGANAQFAGQGTPKAGPSGQSQAYLSAVATSNTHPFRIVGLGQKIGNDNTAPYNTVEVVMNFSQQLNTTGV